MDSHKDLVPGGTVLTPLHLGLVLHAPFGLGHGLDGDVDEQHA
jgi:hypothetical protein